MYECLKLTLKIKFLISEKQFLKESCIDAGMGNPDITFFPFYFRRSQKVLEAILPPLIPECQLSSASPLSSMRYL